MRRHLNSNDEWLVLHVPELSVLPRNVVIRSERLAAHSVFPLHSHSWNQLVYAVSGSLAVAVTRQHFIILPEQAVWIPKGTPHSVRSHFGAEFRSLYVAANSLLGMPDFTSVLDVTHLLRALIIEAVDLEQRREENTYTDQILMLIQEQLKRLPRRPYFLPWPKSRMLQKICEDLYKTPSDARSIVEWGAKLGASDRTLSRQFEREMRISFRAWRCRLRAFKAMELLTTGLSVTAVALELGYASTSAFGYMFRKEFDCSPTTYRNRDVI